jgi:hypothetical protein
MKHTRIAPGFTLTMGEPTTLSVDGYVAFWMKARRESLPDVFCAGAFDTIEQPDVTLQKPFTMSGLPSGEVAEPG